MATASELMSYQGSGGLGSNADIPVSPDKPLDFVNTVIRDIAARDFQKNIFKYQQQIKDRDNMMQALQSGTVKVGDLLQDDMPKIKELGDKQLAAYKNWMQKGYGDIDGITEYKRATRELQDAVTQAEMRKLVHATEGQKIAGEKIPKYAEARRAHLDKFIKGDFFGDWNPFQESNRLNMGEILALPKLRVEEIYDPKRPFEKGKRTYFDFGDVQRAASNYSTTPEGLYNLELFKNQIEELPPVELMDKIKLTNEVLRQRNIPEIVAVQMPNGQFQIKEPIDQLAAKFAIAAQPKFDDTVWELDKAKSDRDIDLKKIAQQRENAQLDYKAAMAGVAVARDRLKFDKDTHKDAKDDDIIGADSVLTKVVENVKKTISPNWVVGAINKMTGRDQFADPTLLKEFSNLQKDEEGKYMSATGVKYNKATDQLEITFKSPDGYIVVPMNGQDYLSLKVKQTFPNKDIGTINDIVSDVYQKSGGTLWGLMETYGKGMPSQSTAPSQPNRVTDPELLKQLNGQ